MSVAAGVSCSVAGAVLLMIGLAVLAWTRMAKRWKRNMDVSDDPQYVANLAMLSEASVRRHFNPYTDIDWEAPEFCVTRNDPRWVLSTVDPFGRHPWYQAQPLQAQIAVGMWRQANIAKVSLHLENILIRGLMHYTFWVPNGSPEYRYCVHEAIEECNHTLMFQEVVDRIGIDVPGMPRWLRWISPAIPLYAGPLPAVFFFGVLAGEVPVDYLQTNMLREDSAVHPITKSVMGIHVAEEARHIAFGHEYLRRHVPRMLRASRFVLSLYVPIAMRVLGRAIIVPPRRFFAEFDIPRSVRNELLVDPSGSHQVPSDMFADIRMLCHDVGLMNPVARRVWRWCRIDGPPSRYRAEPQRGHPPALGRGRAHLDG
jgi:hypothetical protein